jgi:hypothetical protein
VDPSAVAAGNGEVTAVVSAVGDALGDALVRPGRVVVHLVISQDGAQMAFPEDQHAVQELTAQVPTRRSQIAFIRGARTTVRTILVPGGLEDRVERGSEVRSAIADEEPDVLEPLAESESEVAGLCTVQSRSGAR